MIELYEVYTGKKWSRFNRYFCPVIPLLIRIKKIVTRLCGLDSKEVMFFSVNTVYTLYKCFYFLAESSGSVGSVLDGA